jgi:hypothetical protein
MFGFSPIKLSAMKATAILLSTVVSLISTKAQNTVSIDSKTENSTELPVTKNEAFNRGEVLEFRLHYGFIDAATAKIEITNENKIVKGHNTYHVVGTGRSKGTFDWFFKVRDRYESYIDEEGIFPWMFIRRVDEGGYKINQDYTFLQHKKTVDNGAGKTFDVPIGVQDMISAFYYARTIDYSEAKEGDIFTIPAFVDDEIFPLKMKFKGKGTVETDMGKFKCLKFVPVVQKGRIFKNEEDMTVYISDDKNLLPLMAEAKILFGSLKMELTNYSGVVNPVAKID